jgi:DNA-binding transcriptional MerR regulator
MYWRDMIRRHTIGKAAAEVGVSVETIRYYERIGLINQPKLIDGPRHYDELTVARLRYIKIAQQLGLSLKEIAALLPALREGKNFCAALRNTVQQKIIAVRIEQARLVEMERQLGAFLERCETRAQDEDCPIIRELTELRFGLERIDAICPR